MAIVLNKDRHKEFEFETLDALWQRYGLTSKQIAYLDSNLSRIENGKITCAELLDPDLNLIPALAYHSYRFYLQVGKMLLHSTQENPINLETYNKFRG